MATHTCCFVDRPCDMKCMGYRENENNGDFYCAVLGVLMGIRRSLQDLVTQATINGKGDRR